MSGLVRAIEGKSTIYSGKIDPDEFGVLCEYLESSECSFTKLEVFGDENINLDIYALTKSLKTNNTLITLYLYNNNILIG